MTTKTVQARTLYITRECGGSIARECGGGSIARECGEYVTAAMIALGIILALVI